jgi:hypothetical protein
VTFPEFFLQCLDFSFVVIKCGEVGDYALVEVFDCALKECLFECRFERDFNACFRKKSNTPTTT